jgi:Mg2+-importing ATPase
MASTFGGMFSMLFASAFLPFLPMTPLQILLFNLIYDFAGISIPWDTVDDDYLKIPRRVDSNGIAKFMVWFGPISSIFDIMTFAMMFYVVCPLVYGTDFMAPKFAALFRAGWFVESMVTQVLVIHLLRSKSLSRATWSVIFVSLAVIAASCVIPFSNFGKIVGMMPLPPLFFEILAGIVAIYILLLLIVKKKYIGKYGELL